METLVKRTYDQLNMDEKVRALLGVINEPVSREEIFGFAGIDFDSLSETQKSTINAVFTSSEVIQTTSQEQLYILNEQARESLFKQVDEKSVHDRIVGNALSKITF